MLNAKLIGDNVKIKAVITDSRVKDIERHSLFIALQGNKFDGHNFAKQAVSAGAIALMVNRRLPINVPQLIVTNTRYSLGQLGSWVRQKVPTRILALTGSSGKTSVKEITTAILRQCGHVLATEKNFNNDIGVPMTLLRLTPEHDFSVIELGANCLGEIAWTANLVHPETALVNNLSAAHLKGFGSMSGVAQAKGEIFTGLTKNGRAIFNADSNDWSRWKQLLSHQAVWRFALQNSCGVDFFASDIVSNKQGISFNLHCPLGECKVRLPLLGRSNVANVLAACALALSVGAKLPAINTGLEKLQAIPGRLFPIPLSNNQLLLDDSYNANVGSMITAIQVLEEMPGYRVMVVGDMTELGNEAVKYHQQIGKTIAMVCIDKVLSIGQLSHLISNNSGRGEHFQDKITLLTRLSQLLSKYAVITILVKGSHSVAMNQIVRALQKKIPC